VVADYERLKRIAPPGPVLKVSIPGPYTLSGRLVPGGVPDALAEMLLQIPKQKDKVYTVVCRGRTCLPPITDAEELLKALEDGE